MERKELPEYVKQIIRKRRQEMFAKTCDRAAWYDALPKKRKIEIQRWRRKCLDATKTGILPNPPAWVK